MLEERRLSRRVSEIRESATLAIDARAKSMKAEGREVVNFGAGEPDFAPPAPVLDAAVAACREAKYHRYSPTGGLVDLKRAIVEKTARDSGLVIDPSHILVTNGGKHAIYEAFATILDPGDEVLVPAPYWTTYPEAIRLAGGVAVFVPTTAADDFLVTVGDLDARWTPLTRAVVFVSPSNPTGSVYNHRQVGEIGQWVLDRSLWVICDEIYEHLVYDGATAPSMPVVVPALKDHCIVVNGVAKAYAMTGWRVGWLIGPSDIVAGAGAYQSHSTSNVNNIAQAAALAALVGDQDSVVEMRESYARRRTLIVDMLNAIDGVECRTPGGAFYVYPSIEGLLGRWLGGRVVSSSLDLSEALLELVGVAVVPGEAFGLPGHLRLSYALSETEIIEGVGRMQKLLSNESLA